MTPTDFYELVEQILSRWCFPIDDNTGAWGFCREDFLKDLKWNLVKKAREASVQSSAVSEGDEK